jgi:hypothetical protein
MYTHTVCDEFIIIEHDKYIEIVDKVPRDYDRLFESHDYCYLYPLRNYITDIIASYDNDITQIERQLELDLPRESISINEQLIDDVGDFYFGLINLESFSDTICHDKLHLIMALCTQACMGAVFEVLSQLYTNVDKSWHLMESKKPFGIKIKYRPYDDQIKIKLRKAFHLIDTDNAKIKYVIHFKTSITLDLNCSTNHVGFVLFKWRVKKY